MGYPVKRSNRDRDNTPLSPFYGDRVIYVRNWGPIAHTSMEPVVPRMGYLVGAGRPGGGDPCSSGGFGPVAGLARARRQRAANSSRRVGAVHHVGEVLHLLGKSMDTTGLPEERYS